jgi:hypothetical protein
MTTKLKLAEKKGQEKRRGKPNGKASKARRKASAELDRIWEWVREILARGRATAGKAPLAAP